MIQILCLISCILYPKRQAGKLPLLVLPLLFPAYFSAAYFSLCVLFPLLFPLRPFPSSVQYFPSPHFPSPNFALYLSMLFPPSPNFALYLSALFPLPHYTFPSPAGREAAKQTTASAHVPTPNNVLLPPSPSPASAQTGLNFHRYASVCPMSHIPYPISHMPFVGLSWPSFPLSRFTSHISRAGPYFASLSSFREPSSRALPSSSRVLFQLASR